MRIGFRIAWVLLVSLFVFSCTKNQSNHEVGQTGNHEVKENSKMSQHSNRNIASVSKKKKRRKPNKKVKVIRKGMSIPFETLRHLPLRMRNGYYNIFVEGSKDWERSLKKYKKYSFLHDPMKEFMNLIAPEADADICSSAMWSCEIGNTCTSARSYYDPSANAACWRNYGPEGALADTSHCRSQGSRVYACPPTGLERTSSGTVRLLCTTSGGSSSSCEVKFNNGGYAVRNELQERCGHNWSGDISDTGITCAQLRDSLNNYENMWTTNCTDETKTNGIVNSVCTRMDRAVAQVEERAEEERDPSEITTLDQDGRDGSCDFLARDHAGAAADEEGDANMSPHWETLLKVARDRCRNSGGLNPQALANARYGSCSAEFPGGGSQARLDSIYRDYARSAPPARVPDFVRRFVSEFGLTPSRFENVFCNSPNIAAFQSDLENRVDEYIVDSHSDMVGIMTRELALNGADAASATVLNAMDNPQFNAFREWFGTNLAALQSDILAFNRTNAAEIRAGRVTAKTVFGEINSANAADGDAMFSALLSGHRPGQTASNIETRFQASANGRSPEQKIAKRAALWQKMRDVFMSGAIGDRADNAQTWLTSCAGSLTRETGTTVSRGDDATVTTSYEPNTDGCEYRKVNGDSEYLSTFRPTGPLIVYDKTNDVCMEQDNNAGLLSRIGENPRVEGLPPQRNLYVVEPNMPPTENYGDLHKEIIPMNSTAMETETPGRQKYVLYEHYCPRWDGPVTAPGAEGEEPGAVW